MSRSCPPAASPLLVIAGLLCADAALAFERSDGAQIVCEVDFAGRTARVPEEYVGNGPVGTVHPALGGSAAVVHRNRDGSARIIFDRFVMARIAMRSRLAADLVFYHECAHVRLGTDDEIQANCEAVREMRESGYLDTEGYAALRVWHEGMGRVAPRYGGTGKVFWQRTEACLARHSGPAADGGAMAGASAEPAPDAAR